MQISTALVLLLTLGLIGSTVTFLILWLIERNANESRGEYTCYSPDNKQCCTVDTLTGSSSIRAPKGSTWRLKTL